MVPWHQLTIKHVLSSQQFDKQALEVVFEQALQMEAVCLHCSCLHVHT